MKPSCAVLVSSLLLATLLAAAGASSPSPPPSSLGRHPELLVLGRKAGRELGQSSGYHYYQHQSKDTQQQPEGVAMEEVKKPEEQEGKVRWTADQGEDDAEAGLIYSADYSSVAMHAGSPPTTAKPKHRHPKP